MASRVAEHLRSVLLVGLIAWGGAVFLNTSPVMAQAGVAGECSVRPYMCEDWNGGACYGICMPEINFCCYAWET